MTVEGTLSSHSQGGSKGRARFMPCGSEGDTGLEESEGWSEEGRARASIIWSDSAASFVASF